MWLRQGYRPFTPPLVIFRFYDIATNSNEEQADGLQEVWMNAQT